MTSVSGLNILKIDSSGRADDSASRALGDDLVNALEQRYGTATVIRRDLAKGVPFVDEPWIAANFTPAEERDDEQLEKLSESDVLVAELEAADVIVIGVPIYNFGVPATLKAWVDMITRARLTFRYTDNGPEGLLENKKAYVVVASGGVAVDSANDFATPFLRQVLGFVGITDVSVISAERLSIRGNQALDDARMQIANLIHAGPTLNATAA